MLSPCRFSPGPWSRWRWPNQFGWFFGWFSECQWYSSCCLHEEEETATERKRTSIRNNRIIPGKIRPVVWSHFCQMVRSYCPIKRFLKQKLITGKIVILFSFMQIYSYFVVAFCFVYSFVSIGLFHFVGGGGDTARSPKKKWCGWFDSTFKYIESMHLWDELGMHNILVTI